MSFFTELRRRNVVRVGIAYAIVGWLVAQVAEFAAENFGAPEWVLQTFTVFLVLGLPLALVFAWAFELTPEGIKLEKHVDRAKSITKQTGRKLDFMIIGMMAIALTYLLADKFILGPSAPGITGTAVPSDKSIAVLPFVNMSDDKDYFADGLSEELLNLLARIPGLKVAGRTSSFSFKDKNEDLRTIGETLGVSTVLEGSVRRSGNRLRVTAQLVNVGDGFHIWSQTYDRQMADIFDIQDDVAGAITKALQLHLTPRDRRDADDPTQNTEAYSLYLEALATLRDTGNPLPGIELLDRALALDPSFAKAHERKAVLYWLAGGWAMDAPEAQKLVLDSAQAALAHDPTLIIAQTFRVSADPDGWSSLKGLQAVERAVRAMPNDAQLMQAYCWELTYLGYYREVLDCADRLIDLEPLWRAGYFRKADALIALGRRDEAQKAWRHAAALEGPGAYFDQALDHLLRGEDEQAIALMQAAHAEFRLHLFGLDAAGVRAFVASARDPEMGASYLAEAIAKAISDADNLWDKVWPNLFFLAFGHLDRYFNALADIDRNRIGVWTNSEELWRAGRYLKASGFAAEPRFL